MMDYKEALSNLKSLKLYCNDMYEKDPDEVWKEDCEALDAAISAMQELHALHEQGISLERLKDIDFRKEIIEHINYEDYMDMKDDLEEYKETGLTPDQIREIDKLYSEQAKELGEYRKLGNLEEVREAVEKQKKKKPCASNRCYVCPHCGLVTSIKIKHNYCDACGQHIEWSEEE